MGIAKSLLESSARRALSSRAALLWLLGAVLSHPAGAAELRLVTGNDLLSDRHTADDLYTFSLGIEAQRGAWTLALRENAFTDRAAGVRFDETQLSAGRPLRAAAGWSGAIEFGAVRIGRGLLGERTQNGVHRLLGGEQVALRYLENGVRPRLAAMAERPYTLFPGFDFGPLLALDVVPGLRSNALAALQAAWSPWPALALDAMLGARFADADYPPLVPHLAGRASAARLGVVVDGRYFLHWSYNDHGDRREHLTVGYRFAPEEAGRRER